MAFLAIFSTACCLASAASETIDGVVDIACTCLTSICQELGWTAAGGWLLEEARQVPLVVKNVSSQGGEKGEEKMDFEVEEKRREEETETADEIVMTVSVNISCSF
jgi:hypothetical protein